MRSLHLPISFGEVTWSLLRLQALFKRFVLFSFVLFWWCFFCCSVIIYNSNQVTTPRKLMFCRPELKMCKNISSSHTVYICWAWILQQFTAVGFFQWNWEPKPGSKQQAQKSFCSDDPVIHHAQTWWQRKELALKAVKTGHIREMEREQSRANITRPTCADRLPTKLGKERMKGFI